ncbi:hypothetical protein [Streptomyces sp. CB03234]|uniref:hypothetical protein n=1 Tax=Streptomyces sp. (strain CB03234) TaxID=1703937 RepID=UPI000939FBB9|nr:hypothetical protein [Streptomyces sp. CB03234]
MPPLSDHDVIPCPTCGARIRWTVTAAGKGLAVNADPDPAGNTAVYADVTGRLRSRGLTKERPTLEHAEWRAVPHIATCTAPRPRTGRSNGGAARQRAGVRPVRWQGWQR